MESLKLNSLKELSLRLISLGMELFPSPSPSPNSNQSQCREVGIYNMAGAAICQSVAYRSVIRHNVMFNGPRAGINLYGKGYDDGDGDGNGNENPHLMPYVCAQQRWVRWWALYV